MSEWRQATLGDLALFQRGHDLPTVERQVGTIPVVGSAGVSGFHDVARSNGPGVVIGRSGASIGHATYVTGDFWPLNTSLYVTDFLGNDPRFVYYLLKTIDFESFNSGSAQPSLNRNYFKHVPILLPTPHEQTIISALLGALDDRIVVNQRVAATADMLRTAILEEAQQRDPMSFTPQPLSSIADFVNGKAFTKDATGTGRMVIRIAEINSGPGVSTVYNDLTVEEKHLARPGDVLFAWSGSLAVTRWYRPEGIINQHIFKVIPRGNNPHWLTYEATKSKLAHYRGVAADKATTMGHIQRRHLDEGVLVPNPEALSQLDQRVGSLWHRALAAEQEFLMLARLRDTLLPELMSGRLRVKDAEEVVEQVV